MSTLSFGYPGLTAPLLTQPERVTTTFAIDLKQFVYMGTLLILNCLYTLAFSKGLLTNLDRDRFRLVIIKNSSKKGNKIKI